MISKGGLGGDGLHPTYKLSSKNLLEELNDSAKVNLMPVLQQILLDENLKFLRVQVFGWKNIPNDKIINKKN